MTLSKSVPFFMVPRRILELPGITLQLVRFFETIFSFWHQGEECFLSNSALKERCDMKSLSTVSEAFQYFEEHNELKREWKGNKRYIVQILKSVEIESEGVSPQREGGSRSSEGRVSPQRDIIKQINNINNNIKNSCSSDDERGSDEINGQLLLHNEPLTDFQETDESICPNRQMELFDDFWNAYPRKEGKHAAMKAWKKVKQKEYEQIIGDVIQRKANNWQGKAKQYIPLPATYLNGKRWMDELFTNQRSCNNVISHAAQIWELSKAGAFPNTNQPTTGMDLPSVFALPVNLGD